MRDELTTTPAQTETDTHTHTGPESLHAGSPVLPGATEAPPAAPPEGQPGIVEEVLVEEVSIDGMCGVY